MTKKNWTDSELDSLARRLIEQYPERGFGSVKQPYDVNLSDVEFTPILHACLPPERHGTRPKISRLKRDLVKAFDRVAAETAGNPASMEHTEGSAQDDTAGAARIRWGQDDWRFCALALHTMCPELDLVNAPNLSAVTLHQLNLAASAMEQGRQRKFKRLADATDRLAQVYKQARENRDPFYFGRAETAPDTDETPADVIDVIDTPDTPAAPSQEQPVEAQQPDTPAAPPAPEKFPDAPAPVLHTPLKPGIYWTADEYKAIATELRPTYPRVLEDGYLPGLNITELNLAIRKALPPERQRRMANQAHIRSFGNRLRDALAGKPIWNAEQFAQHEQALQVAAPAAEPAAEPEAPAAPLHDFRSGPRVFWSSEEWDALIRRLYQKYPQVQVRFRDLNLSMLNDTAQQMERPRRFFSVRATLKHLEPAIARVKQADTTAAAPAPAPAPVAPAAPAPREAAPAPAAPAAPASELADKMFSKITWTREEWLLVAQELHRLFPAHNYPCGQSLVGLDSEDVAFAQQRVLPLERQRRHLKVVSFTTLKAPLERAFADLRATLEGRPLPACTLVPPAPPAAAVPAQAPLDLPPGGLDPYRAAFAPLVSLLAGEVAKVLGPMLGVMIEQAVAKLPAATAPAVPQIDAKALAPVVAQMLPQLVKASEAPPKNYGDDKPRIEKPKKLTVGVLVNRPGLYKQELEKAYPMIEVKVADVMVGGMAADRIANCDKAIAMVRFIDHSQDGRLRKLTGDRYAACNGSLGELKRMVGIWLRSQGIQLDEVA
jgi:hypothetical protein